MTLEQRKQQNRDSAESLQENFGGQFMCGVYKSGLCEIVETEKFAVLYECSQDCLRFGAKLYKDIGAVKRLCAVCEYRKGESRTVYAYETEKGGMCSNDRNMEAMLGETYDGSRAKELKRTETFFVNHRKNALPGVNEAGIRKCLALWRMSDTYRATTEQMKFILCTGKTDYVFQIAPKDIDIYCGISYQVPCDLGMLGGNQFFRIRNYQDNSQPWCRFFSNLGYECSDIEVPVEQCEPGKCQRTANGYLLWGVKRYTDDVIVLQGCGGDEYIFRRETEREELFSSVPDQGEEFGKSAD